MTPDSFSDGGDHLAASAAVAHAKDLLAQGADVVDIGGESTRPGASPQTPEAEWARVGPVLEALAGEVPGAQMSIDTRHAETARRALELGVEIVNDVSAASDPAMLEVVTEAGASLVLMHMQGAPRTMQEAPHYDDVVEEVLAFLRMRVEAAVAAGVPASRLWVDPGIGFGKSLDHNLTLLQHMEALHAALPSVRWLLGASRKRFLGALTGHDDPRDRVAGSLACAARCFEARWAAVRVHDVAPTHDLLRVLAATSPGEAPPGANTTNPT